MRVVDLYKVLDDNILIRIVNDDDDSHIVWGNPSDIPVGALEYRVKTIRNPTRGSSIADFEIVIER